MFERFNPEARALVVGAQEQARQLDQNYIGTEHLLLGLVAGEPANVAAHVLRAAGVTHDRVQAQVLAIVGRGDGAAPGHIPFTPRSKKVLELSLREALKLRHKYIGPEHILLGLLREGKGLAAQVLTKLGVDLDILREQVVTQLPVVSRRRTPAFGPARIMVPKAGLTTGAMRAADRAVHRAAGGPVGSQHYLLGLLDEDEGLAAKALAALGVTRESIEAKLTELGPEGTTDEPPEKAGARATRVEVAGNEIAVKIVESDLAARLRNYFEGGKSGPEVPGSEQLWKSLRTALEEMTVALERSTGSEWLPPGFGNAGVATFSVISQVGGFQCKLWTADGVNVAKVRTWLADWFTTKPMSGPDEPCAFLTVAVGRMGDIVPDALDPEAFVIANFGCGPGAPGLAGANRVPLADIIAAAVANLTRPGGSGPQ